MPGNGGEPRNLSLFNRTVAAQGQAADPGAHVWVDASAGAGKTKILSDRIIRLLLAGAAPSSILALTFTNAAAAEMASRVREKLKSYIFMTDATLRAHLRALLTEEQIGPERLQQARGLFYRVLDHPVGLRVHTLHSFCYTLLGLFARDLALPTSLSLASDDVAAQHHSTAFYRLCDAVLTQPGGEKAYERILLQKSSWFLQQKLAAYGDQPPRDWVQATDLCLKTATTAARENLQTAAAALRPMLLERDSLAEKDQQFLARLLSLLEVPTDQALLPLQKLLLTQTLSPRKTLVSKKSQDAKPRLRKALDNLQEACLTCTAYQRLADAIALTEAFATLLTRYRALLKQVKIADNTIYFQDVIDLTAALLTHAPSNLWMLYRLDGIIDHILVDEAQDTSPAQWRIISKLTEDFFQQSAMDCETQKSLFVVGDYKQAIYGFQGADPQLFKSLKYDFEYRIHNTHATFHNVVLNASFRSAAPVLDFVNCVFHNCDHMAFYPHQSVFHTRPGAVEMRPLTGGNCSRSSDVPRPDTEQLIAQHADDLAREIAHRLGSKDPCPVLNRPLEPRDIMILIQRRSRLMTHIIRALKRYGVPVAGPDRYLLTDHPVIRDLVNLIDVLHYPEDDLKLAALLKSPLIGLTDGALQRLVEARPKEKSLWRTCHSNTFFPAELLRRLKKWRRRLYEGAGYDLLVAVLIRDHGMKGLLEHFGSEITDIVDDFLRLVYVQTVSEGKSPEALLQHLYSLSTEQKRHFSATRNAVRIMTVHGAKGLQAPWVYLSDTTHIPRDDADHATITTAAGQEKHILRPKREQAELMNRVLDQPLGMPERDLEEYERLLYVALTRAEHGLVVTGWQPVGSVSDRCWYARCRAAAKTLGIEPTPYSALGSDAIYPDAGRSLSALAGNAPLGQDHYIQPPLQTAKFNPADPMSPSQVSDEGKKAPALQEASCAHSPDGPPQERGSVRGDRLHCILEVYFRFLNSDSRFSLNQVPGYAALAAPDQQKLRVITQEILSLVPEDHQCFPEAAIAGTVPYGEAEQEFMGQIDLMIPRAQDTVIIDYKSGYTGLNLDDPSTFPQEMLVQQAIYQDLLKRYQPGATVRVMLAFIEVGRLVEVPQALLSAHLHAAA